MAKKLVSVPIAVNIKDQQCDLYCGRTDNGKSHATNSSGFGNPFVVGSQYTQEQAVEAFKTWLYSDDGYDCRVRVMSSVKPGMKLGCYCKPKPCHVDVIIEYWKQNYATWLKTQGDKVETEQR